MVKAAQEIFIEIKDSEQKDKILSDLARHSMNIKVKGLSPSADVFDASPRSLEGWLLICKLSNAKINLEKDSSLIVQFDHYDEKYISQTPFKIHEDIIYLDFSVPLFRVQRREDYRLKLPRSFGAIIQILEADQHQEFHIVDLSAGGCRIEVASNFSFQKNKKYSAILKPKDRNEIQTHIEIRHIEKVSEKNFSIGLQFVELTEIQKNRIAALVMDLYRTFFKSRSEK